MAGTGPLTLLAAVGPQDACLPKGHFERCSWLQYTRFATSSSHLLFPSGLDLGGSGRIVLPASLGDILTDLWLEVTLPVVAGWRWRTDVGYRLISSFRVTLGDYVVVDGDGLLHRVLNALHTTHEQQLCVERMTGHAGLDAGVEQQLIVPLRLLCSPVERCKLPLIAMTASRAQVDITLEDPSNLLFLEDLSVTTLTAAGSLQAQQVSAGQAYWDNTYVAGALNMPGPRRASPPLAPARHDRIGKPDHALFQLVNPSVGPIQVQLAADVAFLDTSEKHTLIHTPQTLMSERVLFQDYAVSMVTNNHDVVMLRQITVDLDFMQGAVKEVILVFVDDDDDIVGDAMASCVLSVNNQRQSGPRVGPYLQDPSSYRACNACPSASIYTINLAACSASVLQPNGCLDMTQVGTCSLLVELNDTPPTTRLRVYSLAYRPLLFSSNTVSVA